MQMSTEAKTNDKNVIPILYSPIFNWCFWVALILLGLALHATMQGAGVVIGTILGPLLLLALVGDPGLWRNSMWEAVWGWLMLGVPWVLVVGFALVLDTTAQVSSSLLWVALIVWLIAAVLIVRAFVLWTLCTNTQFPVWLTMTMGVGTVLFMLALVIDHMTLLFGGDLSTSTAASFEQFLRGSPSPQATGVVDAQNSPSYAFFDLIGRSVTALSGILYLLIGLVIAYTLAGSWALPLVFIALAWSFEAAGNGPEAANYLTGVLTSGPDVAVGQIAHWISTLPNPDDVRAAMLLLGVMAGALSVRAYRDTIQMGRVLDTATQLRNYVGERAATLDLESSGYSPVRFFLGKAVMLLATLGVPLVLWFALAKVQARGEPIGILLPLLVGLVLCLQNIAFAFRGCRISPVTIMHMIADSRPDALSLSPITIFLGTSVMLLFMGLLLGLILPEGVMLYLLGLFATRLVTVPIALWGINKKLPDVGWRQGMA
jgi:hypothetical protein